MTKDEVHSRNLLDRNAKWFPGRVAVSQGNRTATFRELRCRAWRAANALRALGVERGGRVAILATNCFEYVEAMFACGLAGATSVPLNFRLSAQELDYIVRDAGCVLLLHTPDQGEKIEQLRSAPSPVRRWVVFGEEKRNGSQPYEELLRQAAVSDPELPVSGDDLFTIMYTSGTTGKPKGVMLTQQAFMRGTEHFALAMRSAPHDVNLQVTPQFHAGGQIYQMAHLLVGATNIVLPRFEPEEVLRSIERLSATAVGFVPAMLVDLLECPAVRTTDFSRLQRVFYGAAPITEDRLALAMELMRAGFQQTYGQTESGVIVTLLDTADHVRGLREDRAVLQSCGRAMLGYEVRIVDEDGDDVEVGDVGEFIVRGESLMTGYLNLPEATMKSLRGGWLYTGDLARFDADGLIYLVDRRNDMIISGGENIYPIEVEHVISSHPDVLDVAVFGIPDDKWGEAVKAVVSMRDGRTFNEESIRSHCRALLGGFKVPKQIECIAAVPRNASGKLLKKELRDRHWIGRTRQI